MILCPPGRPVFEEGAEGPESSVRRSDQACERAGEQALKGKQINNNKKTGAVGTKQRRKNQTAVNFRTKRPTCFQNVLNLFCCLKF